MGKESLVVRGVRYVASLRIGARLANGVVLTAVVLGASALYLRSGGGPDASDPLAEVRMREDVKPTPGYSEFTNNTLDLVCNQLARQTNWTHEDAEYLTDLVKLRYPASVHNRSTRTIEEVEQQALYCMVTGTIADRFRIHAPIDPDAGELLKSILLEELSNPLWSVRLNATSCAIEAGFAADPVIRKRLEQIMSDPNVDVAENAKRQLEHFDRIAESKLRASARKAR